jgi:CubicO group peptidase (beta-lactamase class C family)
MPHQDSIADMLDGYIDREDLAGAATVVCRQGQVVQSCARGWRDREALDFLEGDAIFRIASMSKPITSVAAMMLVEEGAIVLDEPITAWAPEFADMWVMQSVDGSLDDSIPAVREITFRDLLTHRAGLTYGSFHAGRIAAAHLAALGSDIDSPLEPDAWIAALAGLPLIDQPGRGFHYGHSTDVLGFLIARIEGEPLGEVLRRRIFAPLGMADTGFAVPPLKAHRVAHLYGFDEAGKLEVRPEGGSGAGALLERRPLGMTFVSGGAGLWSTLQDYLRFAGLFLGDGMAGGMRLLRPETLQQMMTNQLTEDQRAQARIMGQPIFAGHGFGLGLAVVMEPEHASVTLCNGQVGTVGWPGAYGGWWQADPSDQRIMIFLTQNLLDPGQMATGIGLGVYGAIGEFHRLAAKP